MVAYAAGVEIDDRNVYINHARHLVAAGHTTSHEKTRAGKLDPERGRHRAFYRRSWIGQNQGRRRHNYWYVLALVFTLYGYRARYVCTFRATSDHNTPSNAARGPVAG